MALSQEQKDLVIKIWNEGKSAGEIAAHFNATRGTIVGIIYRARERGVDVKVKGVQTKIRVPKEPQDSQPKKQATRAKKMLYLVKPKVPVSERTIYTLERGQCKYPTEMSSDNEQLFCGEPTERSYCDKHHRLCHTGEKFQSRKMRIK